VNRRSSGDLKAQLRDWVQTDGLNNTLVGTMANYLATMHNLSDGSKEGYLVRLRRFGLFLMEHNCEAFEDADKEEVDEFLSGFKSHNTVNGYITTLKPFYREFLKREGPVKGLKYYLEEIQPISPAELLTPDEVIKISEECGKRREMYKIIPLVFFESCARKSEVLGLKLGDVAFTSVLDKENKKRLIATLHFSRSKANVPKQPVTLVMFAYELKRYCDNHCGKPSDWLFQSPYDKSKPIGTNVIEELLYESARKLGIQKRVNPHWFRHSGLSYFANSRNYNEQLLMWRAGWKNTSMAKRYIHSGAELEKKAYLEKMGYQINNEEDKPVLPKPCPHCSVLNPITNNSCDSCGMPLDLTLYKAEIEKRRNIEQLYNNIQQISKNKLTEQQEMELSKRTDTLLGLLELGRDDLAKEYITKLLENWTKMFLTASF
jgi:integrase/recombinase XerD